MLRAFIVPQRSAAAILFDFATAFPSIAHDWIFLVLERLGIPEDIRRLLRLLYSNVVSLMLFAGAVAGSLPIESGIKQ